MKKHLLIMACLLTFGIFRVQATTYYVNDNTVEAGSICTAVGNAGNNGLTPATPKTLSFVATGPIVAGDIVYIDKGLYSNIWSCGGGIAAGTASNHIRFIGVDSASTIIQGTAGVGGTNTIELTCTVANNTPLYWDFSNLALSGVSMPALYMGNAGKNFSYVSFTDCLIKSQSNSAITLNGSMSNFTFTGCKIQSDQVCVNLVGGSANINNSFVNCRIHHIANNGSTVVAVGNGTRNDNTFDKCTITNAGNGYLFDFPGGNYNNTKITNCQLRGNNSSEAVHISNGCALIGFQFTNNYISNVVTGMACGNPGQGGLNIVNNSFYTSGNCLGNAGTGGYFVDGVFRNNIFYTTATATGYAAYISGTSAPAASDYNLYYTPSGANIGFYGSGKASLAAWQNSFASNDANSATGNPSYTNTATGDLSIPCSSPAFKTGVATSLTTDIFGSARPTSPSKGAYENVTVVSVSATPTAPEYCNGGSTSITASGATTYSWSPATALDATTGATVQANPTSTTTYTITGTSAGCTGTATVVVTVHDLPTITVNPTAASICVGNSATLTASGATSFSWSPSTDLDATTGATVEASPTGDITYTVTGTDGNNCSNSTTVAVTVNALPAVPTQSAFADVCESATAVTLSGGAPTGGTYSGTGVSSGSFDPATAGAGTFTITYTITDANLCTASITEDITVNATPAAPTQSAFADVCESATAVTLSGGTPSGGTYSGTGVSSGSFDPATAGAGTHTITYTITDANLCTASTTEDITVNTCTGTGVNDYKKNTLTTVFPNPNDGSFVLTFAPDRSGTVNMIVLNAQGKEQYRRKMTISSGQSSERVSLDLLPGVYHLQLLHEGTTYHEKVVIQ